MPARWAMVVALLLFGSEALAQAPRTRVFTTSHDFLSNADLSGGVVVVSPGTNTSRATQDRLSNGDSSLRLPVTTSAIAAPNLVRPNVTVDGTEPGFTSAPITNGFVPAADAPGYVWRSQTAERQHYVDLAFHDGPRTVTGVTIRWGGSSGPSRYKVQVSDTDGWLVDATSWLNASGVTQSAVPFPGGPISTRRVRVVQDRSHGPAGAIDVMSVGELTVETSDAPVTHPVSVDSSYVDYAPSFIADGDTRVGAGAEYWTEVWVSESSSAQHWVEVDLGAPRQVAQAVVYWGHWGSARFKVQFWTGSAFADTSTSVGTWLNGGAGQAVSRVQFEPVTTTRVRILQDSNGGFPPVGDPRFGLMSVAELELRSAGTFTSGLFTGDADSSFFGYSPGALIDGVRTATCAPSACDGPGLLWVSAETPVDHFVQLQLGQIMWVGTLRIDWGAWGSNSFTVQSWNGINWVDHLTGSAGSNGLIEVPLGVYTDRLLIVQPAGAGAGRPADGFVRPNLMSIGELALTGYRGDGRYVSAPIRLSDPAQTILLTATQTGIGGGQSASYSVSTDDGATWTALTLGVPASPPPGDRVRWRVDLASPGIGTPEVSSVQLAFTGVPRAIAPALWRGGRAGAVTVGVDDSSPTMLAGAENYLTAAGYRGTSFVQTGVLPPFSLGAHEFGLHTLTHGCADSSPDGDQANSLLAEFTAQTNLFDPLQPERGLLQSLAWPCGNYDLAKGSVGRRFFVSARGFRDGDPAVTPLCGPPGDQWACALPEGESMELLEEPTPRNFMNLKGIAIDSFRWIELTDSKHIVQWAEQQGDWANFVYHYFGGTGVYQGEVAEMATRDVWVAPQGDVARYAKLRDSFASETVADVGSSLDFRVSTALTLLDVPVFNHALASILLGDVVEHVFRGGVTARVHSPPSRGTPLRALVWGNGVPVASRAIEGNPYLLFDTPLAPYPTPIHVDWTAPGDADGDGVANTLDNCTYRANANQADVHGVALSTPNLVGDRCECGDVSDDGAVDTSDVTLLRTALTAAATLGAEGLAKCSVIDTAAPTCDVADLVVLRRGLEPPRPLLPGTRPVCAAARP